MLKANLYKKLYNGELNIEFELGKEVLAIQGKSGVGKTTLLECLSGLKSPDEGHISLNNRVMFCSDEKINIKTKDRNVGYVFQNYALFPHMTVKQNIDFAMKYGMMKKEKLDKLMEALKVNHLNDRYPSHISGGEKQRVAFVRSLAASPDLLLLDEPFSALDEETKALVYDEFLSIKKELEIGVILVTHNPQEAQYLGDKILEI